MPDELGRVVRVIDNVDLLAVQFCHYVPNPAPHRADAGALRVDSWLPCDDSDLRTVPGLARDRRDLDSAGRDLGNLEGEQFAHQVGVGARERDRRAPEPLPDVQDVALQPLAVDVTLAWDLLGGRQDRLDP